MKTKDLVSEVTASILAILAVAGSFAIIAFELVNNRPLTLPDVFSLLVGAVVGAYFSNRASQNGARQAGTAAAQTAIAASQSTSNAASTPTVP